ncbi:MAG: DUF4142 domain-containing protein [Pyrinomonadaceae bacterium]
MKMRNMLMAIMVLATTCLWGCASADNANSSNMNANTSNMNATALASPTMSQTPARGVPARGGDNDFLTTIAPDGMAEVELGRLAAQKGQSADVKRFGQRMVMDHTKANNEVKQLAKSKSVTLPAELTAEQKANRDRLNKLSGADFDREYITLMVEDHDKAVSAFQDEAQSGSDAEIKAFATKTLPTLQEHQRMAKDIRDKIK